MCNHHLNNRQTEIFKHERLRPRRRTVSRFTQLDRVGCFQYSPVEGAPANDLDLEIVPDDVKQDRWDRFMAHQQAISSARLQMRIGREIEVLVDEVDEQGAVGRCFFDAPEIDGNVFIDNGSNLKPGDKVWCKVTDADEYDLWAEQI